MITDLAAKVAFGAAFHLLNREILGTKPERWEVRRRTGGGWGLIIVNYGLHSQIEKSLTFST
ncbi:hypothetical protein D3H65_01555 [Paraflavitalea soli]|uniref:Uncharacterized protein n=1 Tax=Paraflavitalea soli TaxID=2315862 RepID=A0A3B7MEH6_9BACT|nr:hypothetical protein D3H65_01555 [Paraflavitalea soli]